MAPLLVRSLPEAIRKNVGGVMAAVESRVVPDLRFPGDTALAHRPLLDWSRPEEHHSSESHSSRKESEEDSGRATRSEGERRKEPEKASAPVKEKASEATKAPEAKPQQPQRQLQRAITGGSGAAGGDKDAGGPSAAERAETVKKMSEQFQMSPTKPEMLRNAPLMTPLPGQTQAKEPAKPLVENQATAKENAPTAPAAKSETAVTSTTTTTTTAKSESKPEGPARGEGKTESSEKGKSADPASRTDTGASARDKSEASPQENLRRAVQVAREADRGEDFTGMRRSTGYQQAKSEMDVRQQHQPRETSSNHSEPSELRQSHSSQSSQGESEGRGHQDKPGEGMQQRSDRGERHQRRRQNGQSGLELENEEEDALLEFEE